MGEDLGLALEPLDPDNVPDPLHVGRLEGLEAVPASEEGVKTDRHPHDQGRR